MNPHTVTVFSAMAGMLVGGTGMWWSLKDRVEKEVEERVTVKIELARCHERLKSVEADMWQLKSKP